MQLLTHNNLDLFNIIQYYNNTLLYIIAYYIIENMFIRKEVLFLKLDGKKVGFAFTGSFCTFKAVLEELKKIKKENAEIVPIMSFNSYNLDTKFGTAEEYINKIKEITEKEEIIHTIQGAEPIGPKKLTDIMVIAPCSR